MRDPILLGVRWYDPVTREKFIRAWCPFCRQDHFHPQAEARGIVKAKCSDPESPFLRTGYRIRVTSRR